MVDETGIEQPAQTTMRAKLLQFHENYRPAYYGTWRRRSERISPRNPLKKDEVEITQYRTCDLSQT